MPIAISSTHPSVRSEIAVTKACVMGGGAFGTALALILAKKGAEVAVWDISAEHVSKTNAERENKTFFAGFPLPTNVTFFSDVSLALEGVEIVLLAIPTQFLRSFLANNLYQFPEGVPLVCCAKGIEVTSLKTPFQIMHEELPGKYSKFLAVLSGPSFAAEMGRYEPTCVSVAANDASLAEKVQRQISCLAANFRAYTVPDVVGCEIAGAVKNVLAIASGASSGCGFGNNTRAALICRGLSEMTRLAKAMGASGAAMPGLAGVGDLLLTCSSELSRNFTVGLRLAKGETIEQISASTSSVAEGVATAKSLKMLCEKLGVDMPICRSVYEVIYEKKTVLQALKELQERPLTTEVKDTHQ